LIRHFVEPGLEAHGQSTARAFAGILDFERGHLELVFAHLLQIERRSFRLGAVHANRLQREGFAQIRMIQ
jgi:hypothetical protein